MKDRLEYFMLVQIMALEDRVDRDSLIAVFRQAYRTLAVDEYQGFQDDVRLLLGERR